MGLRLPWPCGEGSGLPSGLQMCPSEIETAVVSSYLIVKDMVQ